MDILDRLDWEIPWQTEEDVIIDWTKFRDLLINMAKLPMKKSDRQLATKLAKAMSAGTDQLVAEGVVKVALQELQRRHPKPRKGDETKVPLSRVGFMINAVTYPIIAARAAGVIKSFNPWVAAALIGLQITSTALGFRATWLAGQDWENIWETVKKENLPAIKYWKGRLLGE